MIRDGREVPSGDYWIELAASENTLFALLPIMRMVPTTMTRMTASMTAYSAMSCPWSSDQSLEKRGRDILFTNLSGDLPRVIVNDPIVPEQMTKVT